MNEIQKNFIKHSFLIACRKNKGRECYTNYKKQYTHPSNKEIIQWMKERLELERVNK